MDHCTHIYNCLLAPDCCVEHMLLHNLLGASQEQETERNGFNSMSKEAAQADVTDLNVLVKLAIFACQWMTSAALISI
jgi:hypothetical protein